MSKCVKNGKCDIRQHVGAGNLQNELTPMERSFIAARALLGLKNATILPPLLSPNLEGETFEAHGTGEVSEETQPVGDIAAFFALYRSRQADSALWACLHGMRLAESEEMRDQEQFALFHERYQLAAHARLAWIQALYALGEIYPELGLADIALTFDEGYVDEIIRDSSGSAVDFRKELDFLHALINPQGNASAIGFLLAEAEKE